MNSTSAKQKGSSTLKQLLVLLEVDNLTEDNIEFLECFISTQFKKHERDTRYKAIEVLQDLERHEVDACFADGGWSRGCVVLEDAVRVVQGLEVGNNK